MVTRTAYANFLLDYFEAGGFAQAFNTSFTQDTFPPGGGGNPVTNSLNYTVNTPLQILLTSEIAYGSVTGNVPKLTGNMLSGLYTSLTNSGGYTGIISSSYFDTTAFGQNGNCFNVFDAVSSGGILQVNQSVDGSQVHIETQDPLTGGDARINFTGVGYGSEARIAFAWNPSTETLYASMNGSSVQTAAAGAAVNWTVPGDSYGQPGGGLASPYGPPASPNISSAWNFFVFYPIFTSSLTTLSVTGSSIPLSIGAAGTNRRLSTLIGPYHV